jgi:hypothetical protein
VLKTLVAYRLLDPGSGWKLHRSWFDRSAMADLLDDDFRLAAKDTLYRCHDRLLDHRDALFFHLKDRWTGLFGASYDILLYDLTSAYFEVDANRYSPSEAPSKKPGATPTGSSPFTFLPPRERVTSETFRIEPDRKKLRATRRHERQYLLRSTLPAQPPPEIRNPKPVV